MRLPRAVLEWVKEGLDYEIKCIILPSFITPVVIPAEAPTGTGEGDPVFTDATEGVLTNGSVIADSQYIGVNPVSGHPVLNFKHTLTIEALRLIGLTSPNDYMWVPRYGTVVPIGGVNYTLYSMQVLEETHWYKDFKLIPVNIDPLAPHNIYFIQFTVYKPVLERIRNPISDLVPKYPKLLSG